MRKDKRETLLLSDKDGVLSAARSAMETLQKQVAAVEEAAAKHLEVWGKHYDDIDGDFGARVAALEERCSMSASVAVVPATPSADDMSTEAMITSLQAAVATVRTQLAEQASAHAAICQQAQETHLSAIAQWRQHCEYLKVQPPGQQLQQQQQQQQQLQPLQQGVQAMTDRVKRKAELSLLEAEQLDATTSEEAHLLAREGMDGEL